MNQGYRYFTGKKVGYRVEVGTLVFHNVAYDSLGELKARLVNGGYKKEDIEVERVKNC
jgi:hypothetical protein